MTGDKKVLEESKEKAAGLVCNHGCGYSSLQMTNRPVISVVALGFSILALGVSTMALESVSKTTATRCALSVGDIIRRHDGKSYIVDKVWFNEKNGHWIADESPLEEL